MKWAKRNVKIKWEKYSKCIHIYIYIYKGHDVVNDDREDAGTPAS